METDQEEERPPLVVSNTPGELLSYFVNREK
jgi:hypothetical protein